MVKFSIVKRIADNQITLALMSGAATGLVGYVLGRRQLQQQQNEQEEIYVAIKSIAKDLSKQNTLATENNKLVQQGVTHAEQIAKQLEEIVNKLEQVKVDSLTATQEHAEIAKVEIHESTVKYLGEWLEHGTPW